MIIGMYFIQHHPAMKNIRCQICKEGWIKKIHNFRHYARSLFEKTPLFTHTNVRRKKNSDENFFSLFLFYQYRLNSRLNIKFSQVLGF